MKREQIVDFTRRISQCNKGGLIVVMYDIFFAYMDEAKEAYEAGEWEAYKDALRRGGRMIEELISALDFSYELAGNLYSIYVFCRHSLAKAMYKQDIADADDARRLMEKLRDAFVQAAGEDTSAPLMKNTQQVYAGYTYGRDDLVETYQNFDTSRGFFA